MPEKILGIDIGDSALKAVLVTHGIRTGFKVEMAEVIDIAAAGGAVAALAALGVKVNFRSVQINLSLPAELVSFHLVKLPFREAKKIRQTIAFELETMLPQGIENSILDYNIIRQSHHSEILAALVPRPIVQQRCALFGKKPPAPGFIGIGALAVASMLTVDQITSGSALLLDVGVRQTTAVFIEQGKVVQVRCYAFGGENLSREGAVAGTLASQCPEDQPGGQESAPAACRRFCQQLANTLEYLQWGGSLKEGLSRILLTGGGSLHHGLTESLANGLSVPAGTVDVAMLAEVTLPEEIGKTWRSSLMNQALALAITRYKRGQGFNFALQELEKQARRVGLGRTLKWGVGISTVAAVLLFADAYLGYRYHRHRLDNLKNDIRAVFKAAAPEMTRIVDPVQQFKVKIAETKKISAGLGGVENSATVLDLLKDISNLAPPATEFLMAGFSLDGNRLVIKGTVKNFDAVDTLKKELAKSKYLTGLQIGATSLQKQGDKVEFDLRMTVQR